MYKFRKARDLVHNFCNIGTSKSFGLSTKWYVEVTFFIKTNHTIKTTARKKKEIKRVPFFIKPLTHTVVMRFAFFSKKVAFVLKKSPR